jgi:hypothetical protein
MKISIVNAIAALLSVLVVQCSSVAFARSGIEVWGTPVTQVDTGSYYSFTPRLSRRSANGVTFSIANCPSWALCDSTNGSIKGTAKVAGVYNSIVISASDATSKASLPPFAITVGSGHGTGTGGSTSTPVKLQISGQPSTVTTVGASYSLTPAATDAAGSTLTFSITGKPDWLAFSSATGALTGVPGSSDIGHSSPITISVSDGEATASLAAFTITVGAAEAGSGTATISWTPPTQNTNGATLTNLAGYEILYGQSANSLNSSMQISNPGLSMYVLQGLGKGTWYFGVKSITDDSTRSALSNLGNKTFN